MKKRSLLKVLVLTLITLGLYEFYWLYKTRNEMVREYNVKIPNGWWPIIVNVIQIGCFVFIAYALLFAVPANNRRTANVVRPSAECFVESTQSVDSVANGGIETVSQDCKNQIAEYFKRDNSIMLLATTFGLSVISFALLWLILTKWYMPYATSISRITNGRLDTSSAILLLILVPSPFGMVAVQDALNKS